MNDHPQVVLKPRKAQPFFGRHPWVLESATAAIAEAAADGDVVDLISDKGQFIARGVLNRNSRICVRLYTWDPNQQLDKAFWKARLARAVRMREMLGLNDRSSSTRLVFGEADGLSGLVVDRYAEYLVVQYNAMAMQSRHQEIGECLRELLEPRAISFRTEESICKLEGTEPLQDTQWGAFPDGPIEIVEHGLRFAVDVVHGQKTGFYLDQRDNRRAAAGYAKGRTVLDLFCYTGGFGIVLAGLGGALHVTGVDSSSRAIETARINAERNRLDNLEFVEANCFKMLEKLHQEGRSFGMLVLDPPKFAHSRRKLDEALRAYFRLNRLAVDLLEPEGILVTCSCTGSVTREDLMLTLSAVAQKSKREIRILEQRGPSPDHPVSATCLENDYLKCFICSVD